MALSQAQINQLIQAINAYNFPPKCYDIAAGAAVTLTNMIAVEIRIKSRLTGGNPRDVHAGLADIVYWGWGQTPLASSRVNSFLSVAPASMQIANATALFAASHRPSLIALKNLGLPELTAGVSFTSKIRAFLDPDCSAVLDRKLIQIHQANPATVLARIKPRMKNGQPDFIPLNQKNSAAYEDYCDTLLRKNNYPQLTHYRAVDIERGLFHLIGRQLLTDAANILAAL